MNSFIAGLLLGALVASILTLAVVRRLIELDKRSALRRITREHDARVRAIETTAEARVRALEAEAKFYEAADSFFTAAADAQPGAERAGHQRHVRPVAAPATIAALFAQVNERPQHMATEFGPASRREAR